MASASAERAKNLLFSHAVVVKSIAERKADARAEISAAIAAEKRRRKGRIMAIIFPEREPVRTSDWRRRKKRCNGRSRITANYIM